MLLHLMERLKMTLNSSQKTICKAMSKTCCVFRAILLNFLTQRNTMTSTSEESCTLCFCRALSCSHERSFASLSKPSLLTQASVTDSIHVSSWLSTSWGTIQITELNWKMLKCLKDWQRLRESDDSSHSKDRKFSSTLLCSHTTQTSAKKTSTIM